MSKHSALTALASVEIFLGSGKATDGDVLEIQQRISEIARQIETGEGLVIAQDSTVTSNSTRRGIS